MILDKFVNIVGHPRNYSYYKKLGYDVVVGKEFDVIPNHLKSGSPVVINCQCDACHRDISMEFRFYFSYTKGISEPYYCVSCKGIKSKKTSVEKYGVDNPMKSDSVKEILKNSLLEKYGVDHYSKTDDYKEKYKITCLEKYGVDNASKSDVVKKLISELKFKELNSIDKFRNIISNEYEIISYSNNRVFSMNHKRCGLDFEIFIGTFNDRNRNGNIICTKCNKVEPMSSGREIELQNFLTDNDIEFVSNSYSIISPLSLDIYIPELKLAIEFNGVYWHSELFKDKYYHLDKTKICLDNGISLIHIWEDDWIYRQEIIKSIILNKVGKIKEKVYARKCDIREIYDVNIVREFLNKNHIQGYSNSTIKIGLYYNNDLISLMIFGKKRKNMELVRFCNKVDVSVVGGASRLFKYFIEKYKCDYIESFSESSIFGGEMYENLGFNFDSNTSINYWWVIDGIRKHRFNFNKKKLVKMGNDSNLSESEIMKSLGYYKIWGCGLKKWVYKQT